MWEDAAMLAAQERIEEARRAAAQARAVRRAPRQRRPFRVRLGAALVRLGTWMLA
ncbi:MAG: hypothetical protein ACE147_15440 [Candidatus Methylomirabilales bacterium]